MYIDIEDEIRDAVADHFANGGDGVTYEEYDALLQRVKDLEERLSNIDFFKADRNHSHQSDWPPETPSDGMVMVWRNGHTHYEHLKEGEEVK